MKFPLEKLPSDIDLNQLTDEIAPTLSQGITVVTDSEYAYLYAADGTELNLTEDQLGIIKTIVKNHRKKPKTNLAPISVLRNKLEGNPTAAQVKDALLEWARAMDPEGKTK